MWVQSLASLSGLRIHVVMSCGIGCRQGSDLMFLWLWWLHGRRWGPKKTKKKKKANKLTDPSKKEQPDPLNFCAPGSFVLGSHHFIFLVGLIISVLITDGCKISPLRHSQILFKLDGSQLYRNHNLSNVFLLEKCSRDQGIQCFMEIKKMFELKILLVAESNCSF